MGMGSMGNIRGIGSISGMGSIRGFGSTDVGDPAGMMPWGKGPTIAADLPKLNWVPPQRGLRSPEQRCASMAGLVLLPCKVERVPHVRSAYPPRAPSLFPAYAQLIPHVYPAYPLLLLSLSPACASAHGGPATTS